MTIDDLNKNLDSVITTFENKATTACSYCDDEFTFNALSASHQAISSALSSFKRELITYLQNN